MQAALSVLGIAIVAFASTNIDDLVVISAFFADASLERRAIVVGQLVGIGLLTAVSVIAAMLALAVPPGWTALLGLAPLGLGVAKLRTRWRSKRSKNGDPGIEADADEHRIAGAVL